MTKSIAIVGAGMAGLSCAQYLLEQGFKVKVFEKSRGLAGRSATRNRDGISFDHGAQFFSAKSQLFKDFVHLGIKHGNITPWQPKTFYPGSHHTWYVGVPGMSSIARQFHLNHYVQTQALVEKIQLLDQTWEVSFTLNEESIQERFDGLILAIPAPQALSLLNRISKDSFSQPVVINHFIETISAIDMLPCWTVMLNCSKQLANLWPYDVWQCPDNELDLHPIGWFANNSSKPLRTASELTDQWILQASPEWSKKHLEDTPETIISALTQELEMLLKISITPLIASASTQRWRYARVSGKMSQAPTYLFDAESDLGLCGDYFSSSRIESAFLSGHGLASAFVQNLQKD